MSNNRGRYLIYLVLSIGVALTPLLFSFDRTTGVAPKTDYVFNDFFAYYSAATFLKQGGDPYDHATLSAYRSSLGHDPIAKPLRSLYPPWFFNLSSQFTDLPFMQAYSLWVAIALACLMVSAFLVWRVVDPKEFNPIAALLLALTALPILDLILEGQASALLVLAVGLLCYGIGSSNLVAAVGFVLLTIKPHLFLPFGAVLLIRRNEWGTLKPMLFGVALFTIVSLLTELRFPGIHGSWWLSISSPPLQFRTPCLSYNLIRLMPEVSAPIIAVILGLAGIVLGYFLTRDRDFKGSIPILLILSLIVAPYCWIGDFMILVIPQVMLGAYAQTASAKVKAEIIYLIIATQLTALILAFSFVRESYQLWWYPCLILGLVLLCERRLAKPSFPGSIRELA